MAKKRRHMVTLAVGLPVGRIGCLLFAGARNAQSTPSLSLEKHAGIYEDAWYGPITIRMENGSPVISFGHSQAGSASAALAILYVQCILAPLADCQLQLSGSVVEPGSPQKKCLRLSEKHPDWIVDPNGGLLPCPARHIVRNQQVIFDEQQFLVADPSDEGGVRHEGNLFRRVR